MVCGCFGSPRLLNLCVVRFLYLNANNEAGCLNYLEIFEDCARDIAVVCKFGLNNNFFGTDNLNNRCHKKIPNYTADRMDH